MASGQWSLEALQVLGLFRGGRKTHGYAVCQETGLSVSTVYTILNRLADDGLLHKSIERVDPALSQRAPRLIYRGTTVAADVLEAIRALVN